MHGLLFTLYVLLSSTHVLCTFSNICQHFCEILEIVKPFFFFFSSTSSLLSIDFFVHLSVCGATYLSINVGPQIVMGNRRLFSFVSGASNNCLLPRGRRFIVAEQTMCDYTYVLLNSKWTTWWLLCSCSLQSCVCTGRSDEMKRLAVVILLSSVSQSALSANARFFSPMTPMRLD